MFYTKFTGFKGVTMETRPATNIVVKIGNRTIHFLKVEILTFPKMKDLLCYTSGRGLPKNCLGRHSTTTKINMYM